MIYEQNCYNLDIKYFDNLIEINIKNTPNKFIRFKIYENILHFFKLYKLDILIKYYDKKFLICNELDLKNLFKKLSIIDIRFVQIILDVKKFNLIEVDGMFICKNCNAIFNNRLKLLLIVMKKIFISRKSNIPFLPKL